MSKRNRSSRKSNRKVSRGRKRDVKRRTKRSVRRGRKRNVKRSTKRNVKGRTKRNVKNRTKRKPQSGGDSTELFGDDGNVKGDDLKSCNALLEKLQEENAQLLATIPAPLPLPSLRHQLQERLKYSTLGAAGRAALKRLKLARNSNAAVP